MLKERSIEVLCVRFGGYFVADFAVAVFFHCILRGASCFSILVPF